MWVPASVRWVARVSRRRGWAAEAVALLIVLGCSLLIVFSMSRNEAGLLFEDGDSMMLAIMEKSILAGQPQVWALSSVLFIPEIVQYLFVSLVTGGAVRPSIMLNGVANLCWMYAGFRIIASRVCRRRQVARGAALATWFVLGIFICMEIGLTGTGLRAVSYIVLGTYYSATTVALLFTVVLVFDLARPAQRAGHRALRGSARSGFGPADSADPTVAPSTFGPTDSADPVAEPSAVPSAFVSAPGMSGFVPANLRSDLNPAAEPSALVPAPGLPDLALAPPASALAPATEPSALASVASAVVPPDLAPTASARPRRGGRWRWIAMFIIAAVSVLTNPLYLLWVAIPVSFAVLVGATVRLVLWRRVFVALVPLLLGSGLGLLGRVPLASMIMQSGFGYVKIGSPQGGPAFVANLNTQLAAPGGNLEVFGAIALLGAGLLAFGIARVQRNRPASLLALIGITMSVGTVVGFIFLGNTTLRYLQTGYIGLFVTGPAIVSAFAALAPIRALGRHFRFTPVRQAAGIGVLVALFAVVAMRGLAPAATTISAESSGNSLQASSSESDLACAVEFLNTHPDVAASDFWAGRAIKARLTNPSKLIQLGFGLHRYEWLVNRADLTTDAVRYVIIKPNEPNGMGQSVQHDIDQNHLTPTNTHKCGAYEILDFGSAHAVPLGTPRHG